jgi:hypothetical protein
MEQEMPDAVAVAKEKKRMMIGVILLNPMGLHSTATCTAYMLCLLLNAVWPPKLFPFIETGSSLYA